MITIYGHARCGWCIKAKGLAERYRLKYVWKDTDNVENMNNLKTLLPSVKTVPQIWWDDRYIGGYEQFSSEIENTLGNYGQDKV
jgi:glutaredoxin 1